MKKEKNVLQVVELFAGVGGFRLGLELANIAYKIVWVNQWEPRYKTQFAFEAYQRNFGEGPNHSNLNIEEVDVNDIPDHDLLVAGFPCQDYSVANTFAEGIKGKKGVLWWEIYRVLEAKKPTFVLFENVDRLLKSPSKQHGRDFGIILECFRKMGYSVEWRIINSAEHGFPQKRKRCFIFAWRNDKAYGEGLKVNSNNEDIVMNRGVFQTAFPAKAYKNSRDNYHVFIDVDLKVLSDGFEFKFENSGCLLGDCLYTVGLKAIKEKEVPMSTILDRTVAEAFYLKDGEMLRWEYLKGPKCEERINKNGYKYQYTEGAVSFPDAISKPSRTMLTSEGTLNRCSHVIEDPLTKKLRKLTPEECEALNGFPKGWTEGMTTRQRYFCMGNALVVNVVERIGRAMIELLIEE